MMGAVFPAGVHVGVALHAVVVHHQRFSRDVVAGGCASERRLEVGGPFLRPFGMPIPRVLGVERDHPCDRGCHQAGIAEPDLPADFGADEPMQPVEPDSHHGSDHVGPVGQAGGCGETGGEVCGPHPKQQPSRDQHHQPSRKEGIAHPHRTAVFPGAGVEHVDHTKHQERRDEQDPQHKVREEHPLIEPVLKSFSRGPFGEGHRSEVARVGTNDCQHAEDGHQNNPQAGADRRDVLAAWPRWCR